MKNNPQYLGYPDFESLRKTEIGGECVVVYVEKRRVVKIMNAPFTRFVMVGGMATALQFVLLVAFVELGGMRAVVASALSFSISAVFNYILNYRLTFESSRRHMSAFPRFVAVAMIGLAINVLVFAVFNMFIFYVVAQMFATGAAMLSNYFLHKKWTFVSDV